MELTIDNEDQELDERNEKLKKAIERNRSKQAKRDAKLQQEQVAPELPSNMPQSFFEQNVDVGLHVDPSMDAPSQNMSINSGVEMSMEEMPLQGAMGEEFTLDEEFEEYEEEQSSPGVLSFMTGYIEKCEVFISEFKERNLVDYLVYAGWIFCFFLCIRLIVTERGVIDYYSMSSVLNNKKDEISRIEEENIFLLKEIDLIKSDKVYQKKLVRDVLGFIAKDEYLILFPKEGKKKSK